MGGVMDFSEMINQKLREELYFELGAAMQFCMNHSDAGLARSVERISEIHARLAEPKHVMINKAV
jgi:hypothetical protein